jgi:alginate O-acetyltransferase complex protein AlgI
MAKKVLVADTLGAAVAWAWGNIGKLNSTGAIFAALCYSLQIYFDFSGYCDMATGIGKMFNVDITANFNSPYRAVTIDDFWKRWHMTLTRFFSKYVYIPLGGSRKGAARTYLNIAIVFLLSGMWHGANWTFLLWGAMHGAFSIVTRIFKKGFARLHPAVNWVLTFAFVNVGWIYFRSNSIKEANSILKRIAAFNFGAINGEILNAFQTPEIKFLVTRLSRAPKLPKILTPAHIAVYFAAFALIASLCAKNTNERIESFKPTPGRAVLAPFLLVWSICSFAGVSVFLYFNF